jgi:methylenetetrahydrofolate dehydrogenase (NADP+)/methenyltetrahydrofolate cyclohydrolase
MRPTNMAKVIDGRPLARRILEGARDKVAQIQRATGVTPVLATILVGDDPASATYVRMKAKRCADVGVRSLCIEMPLGTTTEQLLARVRELGADPGVHGLLIQHPVPRPIDKRAAFETVPVEKDVDGVTSATLGRTILGLPALPACTPTGIMRLLAEYQVPLDGTHAVVIGRSPILGRPMASMLINAHATVTLCHSRTRDLPHIVEHADLLIAAIGRPRFVQGDWIRPGAVVIDAGYNEGIIGDVDFEAASRRAALISPVPGGVGPMTIAILVDHTCDAAAQQLGVAFTK